jgi:hypothetical protein
MPLTLLERFFEPVGVAFELYEQLLVRLDQQPPSPSPPASVS